MGWGESGFNCWEIQWPALVLQIQSFLCDLQARRKFVPFCCIPSHVGLSGNEKADILGKRAIQLPLSQS